MIANRPTVPSTRQNRARLSLQALEARDVPSGAPGGIPPGPPPIIPPYQPLLDLTSAGAQATANGGLLTQTTPVADSDFHTFLTIRQPGLESGYNTDARPFQLNQQGDLTATRSLLLADVPVVNISGTDYRQFVLDVSQLASGNPGLTMQDLRVYVAGAGNLTGYSTGTKTLAGLGAVWDMDGAGDVSVKLNGGLNTGAGKGDVFVYIPSALFGSSTYVYLFSEFAGKLQTDTGVESWGVLPISTGGGGGGTASISGAVYFDVDGDHVFNEAFPDQAISGVTVVLQRWNGTSWIAVGEQATGDFSFTGLSAGTYRLTKLNDFDPALLYDGLNQVGTANGVDPDGTDTNPYTQYDSGWSSVDLIDTIVIGDGVHATGYNFEVVPVPSGG